MELTAIVRIERRLVGHRQHLTRIHIQYHHRTRVGVCFLDCRFQRTVRQILDTQVDARLEIFTRASNLDVGQILDIAPHAIALNALRAILATERLVVAEFQAFLAVVFATIEAQHMPHHFTGGIVTTVLAFGRDPGNLHLHQRR